jgi:folate-dependent phosphoribosylglycinamide formyltransferase PurN
MSDTFKEISDWLRKEAESRISAASSRRANAKSMREATAEDLRTAKRMAEKMSGKKLDKVSVTTESAKASASLDEKIAAKLEDEARQLLVWSGYLSSEAGL